MLANDFYPARKDKRRQAANNNVHACTSDISAGAHYQPYKYIASAAARETHPFAWYANVGI
jgi:hypothetical protein